MAIYALGTSLDESDIYTYPQGFVKSGKISFTPDKKIPIVSMPEETIFRIRCIYVWWNISFWINMIFLNLIFVDTVEQTKIISGCDEFPFA